MWKYIKGSEKDFEGAPEWAKHKTQNSNLFYPCHHFWEEDFGVLGKRYCGATGGTICIFDKDSSNEGFEVIAERVLIRKSNKVKQKPPVLNQTKVTIFFGGETGQSTVYHFKHVISFIINPKRNVLLITHEKTVDDISIRINTEIPFRDISNIQYQSPTESVTYYAKEGTIYGPLQYIIQR